MPRKTQPTRQTIIKSPQSIEAQSIEHLNLKNRFLEGLGIAWLAIALFLGLSMLSYQHAKTHSQLIKYAANNIGGELGYYFARSLFISLGTMAYVLPPILGYIGVLSFKNRLMAWRSDYWLAACQFLGFALVMISGCGFNTHFKFHNTRPYPGGLVGFYIKQYLGASLGPLGIQLFLTVLLLTGITLSTGVSWVTVIEQLGHIVIEIMTNACQFLLNTLKHIVQWTKLFFQFHYRFFSSKSKQDNVSSRIQSITALSKTTAKQKKEPILATPTIKQLEYSEPVPIKRSAASSSLPPSLDLLDLPDKKNTKTLQQPQELESLAREVESRLKEFGIQVEVVGIEPGPVVTRFELQLAPGIKASRITTLARDLARSLSMTSVRVVEVVPGKPVVGLEVPNQHREIVRLREILSSAAYIESPSPLSMALGKDIAGNPSVVDLAKMPHLLVAGTTGSGKSVGLNAMLLSLIYKSNPDQVRMIMIDPKMLELSIYESIPHLLSPVVTDMKKAANALRWCITEMDRRYKLMSLLGVRNLSGYNQKVENALSEGKPIINPLFEPDNTESDEVELLQPLPYILVLVDEFADMIMVVGKKVEELIARLAQKARAAGIHLILATQRPSVDVITGLIKANIPTRMAFQVSSRIDSRTILDQQGAEQLLGHGDMLYLAPGTGIPTRVHGAFVADHEVHNVVEALKKAGPPDYQISFTEPEQESEENNKSAQSTQNQDPLYHDAVEVVRETRKTSISYIQRHFRIGYNRAANLLEDMEQAGIVSAMDVNGKREILISEKR